MKFNFASVFISLCFAAAILNALARIEVAFACPDIDGLVDVNCDEQLTIVGFGDSITYGKGDSRRLGYPGRLKVLLAGSSVLNRGVSGESTRFGRSRAASILPKIKKADYLIILEGVNDYFSTSRSTSSTKNNLLSIVRSADRSGGISLLSKLTKVNRAYQIGWVVSLNNAISHYTSIDFYSLGTSILGGDGLHPTGNGYQKMAQLAANRLAIISERNRPKDTDGDGLYDWEESIHGTNRFVADSDGDGLSDGDEVYVYHTNPLVADSDADGLSDGYEANVLGSNPSSALPGSPVIEKLEALSSSP